MGQVTVTIAGRSYRMVCGDEDEPRLARLAAYFDDKVKELRNAFGEIGDMRLHVMAALTVADELEDANDRVAALERELTALKHSFRAGDAQAQEGETRLADALIKTAERLERLARNLNPPPPAQTGT
jgi:cell division protein ZapA